MKKILFVFGTRPEAIKMAPLIKELEKYPNKFKNAVCVTAQHREMLDQVLDLFEITPDYDLDLMKPGQDLFDVTCNALQGLKPVLEKEKPDLVLVHGDTTTTMTSAIAAFYCQIPVGHVEAGLRTFNKHSPFPEEVNRQVTSVVTDLHFAPTEEAKKNLLTEGVPAVKIHVTGNTVIDALLLALGKIKKTGLEQKIVIDLVSKYPELGNVLRPNNPQGINRRLILVTGHRRENFGEGFEHICTSLSEIAANHPDVEIIYPVHLNPNVQEPVKRILGPCAVVHLIEPLEYLSFIYLMERATLIMSDSGGVQEEAPSLGKPVLVMRETSERPEAIKAGTVRLVGTDPVKIYQEATKLLTNREAYQQMSFAHNPYGDGKAAERIAAILSQDGIVGI